MFEEALYAEDYVPRTIISQPDTDTRWSLVVNDGIFEMFFQHKRPFNTQLFMTDKADLVCGKEASGKSISTFGSQMAMEWVINSGGEKPGRISMIITSFKDTGKRPYGWLSIA